MAVASLLAAVAVALIGADGVGAAVVGPQAPAIARYQGGAEVSDGVRTLTVSQTSELQPGQTVSVTGTGFDVNKGVYVGLCVVPPAGAAPSPCAGGEDRTGNTGASAWFSSNPPSYADGLPTPYAQGGSFSAQVQVSPALGGGMDCRQVQCAIATRNDHTRSTDRSQDLFIPVTFAAEAPQQAEQPQPTAPPETPAAPVDEPVQATIAEAPATPAPPVEDPPATTAKPKKKATTTTASRKSTTTAPKKTTTTAATTTTKATTTTVADRSEEATITVTSGEGSGGAWGWALAAVGGLAVLGAAGVGVFRVRTGHWPGMTDPGDAASTP